MKTRFAHIADVHLGYQQYGLKERFNDFADAWVDALQQAIEREVQFVVIAGDLFHKRSVEPAALLQARYGLRMLKEKKIPVIAVEGNHERQVYREGMSWMQFLAADGDLHLLTITDEQGQVSMRPCDPDTHQGSYLDLDGVRIVGQQYLGSSARTIISEAAQALSDLPRAEYTIYACHAGIEGVIPDYPGCVSYEDLQPLRPVVDYVALGHIHLEFNRDRWAYNPGSLETCSADEAGKKRGFYVVDVDTDRPMESDTDRPHRARLMTPMRRDFRRVSINAEPCSHPEDLAEMFRKEIALLAREKLTKPVVLVSLYGRLRFDQGSLDLDALRGMITEAIDPLYVDVRNHTDATPYQGEDGQSISREALERQVLAGLFSRDDRYRDKAAAWAALTIEIKGLAVQNADPAVISDLLDRMLATTEAQSAPA